MPDANHIGDNIAPIGYIIEVFCLFIIERVDGEGENGGTFGHDGLQYDFPAHDNINTSCSHN